MTRAGVEKAGRLHLEQCPAKTRYKARRDDVYLFADMVVMIDGIARKAGSPP